MNFKRLMTILGAIILVGIIALSWGCQNQPTGPVFEDINSNKLRPPDWWGGGGWSTTTAGVATTTWGGWSSTTTTTAVTTTTSGGSWWDWSSTTTTSGSYTTTTSGGYTTTTSGGYTTTTTAASTTTTEGSWWGGGSWWGSTTTTTGGGVTGINGNQVLLIGNSYLAMSGDITRDLEGFARDAGILAYGDNFIDNSVVAARFSGGDVTTIPQQYANGNSQRQVRWVIMEGGGNDLEESCNPPTSSCPNLQAAVNALRNLLSQMGNDGVVKVIYFFYPDPQGLDEVKEQLDVLRPMIQDAVNSSRDPVCYWLDLRPVFQGHYSEYVQSDGTHPTAAGSRATADAIWNVIQQNNFFSGN